MTKIKYITTYTENENLLTKYFDLAFRKVVNNLGKKFFFNATTIESLAAEGIEYAARYYLKGIAELTPENLTGMATWKALNLAADLLRRQQRRPEALTLDDTLVGDDGETVEESPTLTRASLRAWQDQSYDNKWRELGDYAYRHLEEMFDLLNLSDLRRDVFRKIYLEEQPVAKVSSDHDIKPNYAYGIVFGVKEGLSKVGPAFLRDAA